MIRAEIHNILWDILQRIKIMHKFSSKILKSLSIYAIIKLTYQTGKNQENFAEYSENRPNYSAFSARKKESLTRLIYQKRRRFYERDED